MDQKNLYQVGGFTFSQDFNELAKALSQAQGGFPVPIKNKLNEYYQNRYADFKSVVDSIKPHLAQHGLFLSISSIIKDNEVIVTALVMHTSGQFMANTTSMHIGKNTYKNEKTNEIVTKIDSEDANKITATATKLARAALIMFFVQPADDSSEKNVIEEPANKKSLHPLLNQLKNLTVGSYQKNYNSLLSNTEKSHIANFLSGNYSNQEIEKNIPKWISYLESKYAKNNQASYIPGN